MKYVDENGKELQKPIKSKGVYGDDYDTDEKEFEGYELVEIPSNASREFGLDNVTVVYVYRLIEEEGGGANEGRATGSGENPDEAMLGTLPLVKIYKLDHLGDLPQTGMSNTLITGLVGGLLSFIGTLILLLRRKSQQV